MDIINFKIRLIYLLKIYIFFLNDHANVNFQRFRSFGIDRLYLPYESLYLFSVLARWVFDGSNPPLRTLTNLVITDTKRVPIRFNDTVVRAANE